MSNKTKIAPKKKIIQIALIALAVLGVATLAWLLLSGRLVVAMKEPGEELTRTNAIVCDIAVVDRFNTASVFKQRGDSGSPIQDVEEFKKLSEDITKLEGYATDPTCQTILFWTALAQNDHGAAEKAYQAVDELHAQNKFANSDLSNNMQLSTYPSMIQSINPDTSEIQEGKGQGTEER